MNRVVVDYDASRTTPKEIGVIVSVYFVSSSCSSNNFPAEVISSLGYEATEDQVRMSPGFVKLRIEGMTCASCVETIKNFVKTNPAITDIQVCILPYASTIILLLVDKPSHGGGECKLH